MSRLENGKAKTHFFITGAKGQISANERAMDDECHLTAVEEEVRLTTVMTQGQLIWRHSSLASQLQCQQLSQKLIELEDVLHYLSR